MSLIVLRQRIKQLQVEIADLQNNRSLLIHERTARQDFDAFQERAGMPMVGSDFQARVLEDTFNDCEAELLRKQSELQAAQLAWIEHLSTLPEKIVVLFFAANPRIPDEQPRKLGDEPKFKEPLRLDEEVRAIAEQIRLARHRDAVKLESCWAVRPLDVIRGLNEHRPRIVHFSGHGETDQIILQDSAGRPKPVSKDALVKTMQAARGDIELVFFNTCYSKDQAQAVVQHVSAAIGMNTAIGDEAARIFSAQFYSAIGFGLSVKTAFDQAQAALMLEDIPGENTPELFVAEGLDADDLIMVRPADLDEKLGTEP